jgi:hypothetical protein
MNSVSLFIQHQSNDNKLVKVIVILEECKINLTLKIKKKS